MAFDSESEKDNLELGSVVRDNRGRTELPRPKQGVEGKKAGALLMISGIVIALLLLLPKLFLNGNDEVENTQTEKETKAQIATYSKPVEETPPKTFSFDEPEESTTYQGPKLGDPVAVSPSTVRVTKSAGEMMVSTNSNGALLINESKQNTLRSNTSTQQAILSAQNRLNELNSPQDQIGNSQAQTDIYKAPAFQPKAATKSIYNSNLLLAQGTYIPCVLRGRLVSNISGQISCIITENVLAESGNVVLVEKGSRVTGFYQGSKVRHGHGEIFVVWQEIRTPYNVVIPLDSGSTDELGANGLNGWVDNHFWERFSNAIILSMIRDVSGALADRLSDKDQDNTENTRQASDDIARVVLEQMGDIAPTVYKNQGDKIGIFVARDIDFSNVYELKKGHK